MATFNEAIPEDTYDGKPGHAQLHNDTHAVVRELRDRLGELIDAYGNGELAGPAGPTGPKGPKGPAGQPGAPSKKDWDALVARVEQLEKQRGSKRSGSEG